MMNIPTRKLGRDGPEVSAIGYGAKGPNYYYGREEHEATMKALTDAADCGMTFWDCTDALAKAEVLVGLWLRETGRRSEIFLSTKFGAWDPETVQYEGPENTEFAYIQRTLQRALQRLGTDYIDLFYMHRVDPNMPIEITMEALRGPLEKGQIRWIGLSECSTFTLRRAKAVPGVGEKLIAVQVEYSPLCLEIDKAGFPNAAKELGVTILATHPLGRGTTNGRIRSLNPVGYSDIRTFLSLAAEESDKTVLPTDKIKAIAKKYNATPAQVGLAWILSEHEDFIPIAECQDPETVKEYAAAFELKLDSEDLLAIREIGEEAFMVEEDGRRPDIERDCITLEDWIEAHSE